jgi:hypothetical protein
VSAMSVPQEAIDAAENAVRSITGSGMTSAHNVALAALEAAAPLIAAAERKRLAAREPGEEPIPDGQPVRAAYWRGRWLWAIEKLDEEVSRCISLHARIRELEAASFAEHDRIRHHAQAHRFTLHRPGNGTAHGESMDVVPLATLLEVL